VLSTLQTLFGGHHSPVAQLDVALLLPLVLASGPLWQVLFLLMHDEGDLRSHHLFCIFGWAHLSTLVLLMVGVYWTLCRWIEGLVVPL
jgi:hypothetical protein